MSPRKEVIGDAVLYLGDCLDVLANLLDGSVDAVVTDPPYGVGYAEWDSAVLPLDWLVRARKVARTVVFTPGNGSQYDYPKPDWTLCWARPGSIQRAGGGGFSHWEPILIYGKNLFPVDYRRFAANTDTDSVAKGHPCPKPVKVMEWMMEFSSPTNGLILDPFMGSGTTGVACANLGRKFIGIEIEPKYFDIACRRIELAYNQQRIPLED